MNLIVFTQNDRPVPKQDLQLLALKKRRAIYRLAVVVDD